MENGRWKRDWHLRHAAAAPRVAVGLTAIAESAIVTGLERRCHRRLAMSGPNRTLDRVRAGQADSNIRFEDLCALLRALGFSERIRGSHHIFGAPRVEELVNL